MKRLRCAVYTRKSSEEGLDQAFNSLDAQREACLAYIASQKGEGWSAPKASHDDGGFSGGSMERPGLERLLAEVAAGKVDVVVVYKVDRLTRSLGDFARIVEIFDRHGVSFVSVTQAFNTTTSMGRLTLNVLLSFAQFEREVTGERIRDKIAASKAKGMWMGGNLPLGYDSHERTLVVNEPEAELVRGIFRRYLELGSVHALKAELDRDGVVSKRRVSRTGRESGGQPFSRGALFHLLRNRVYLGEITHRDLFYPGLHPPIVERAVFDEVQLGLDRNGGVRQEKRAIAQAPLVGLLYDSSGGGMTPTHTLSRGTRYRYYVAADLQQGGFKGRADADQIRRVPADAIEGLVLDRLRTLSARDAADWEQLRPFLKRIEIKADVVVMHMKPPSHSRWERRVALPDSMEAGEGDGVRLVIPARLKLRGGRTWLLTNGERAAVDRPRRDRSLIAGLRRAHAELAKHGMRTTSARSDWSAATGVDDFYLRKLLRLGFLAPDIQLAILDGRQPPGLTLAQFLSAEIPLAWADQRSQLGFAFGA